MSETASQDALRTQLTELNIRSRTYTAHIWQVPFAYLGILGIVVAQATGKAPGLLALLLGSGALVGIAIIFHVAALVDGSRRAVENIRRIERALHLDETAQQRPIRYVGPMFAILLLTVVLCVFGTGYVGWRGEVQQVDRTAFVANILVGLLTGLLSSAYVAWRFTRRAERRERRMLLLQKAHDVARDSHSLLEVTARITYDLACRKYRAHQLAQNTATLVGEEKRRTVNRETMRIHLQEVPRGVLDSLAITLHGHLTALPHDDGRANLSAATQKAAAEASVLSDQLKQILPFKAYFDGVQSQAEKDTFVDFVEKMEQDETVSYKPVESARDAARASLIALLGTIVRYSVEEPASSISRVLSWFRGARRGGSAATGSA